ncbi:MAG: hypothetical protein LBT84_07040 [Spirochaetia bacterium]|jgi:hypothetical protein|nr:hypothetical protein [Spirochaetia bacterium]
MIEFKVSLDCNSYKSKPNSEVISISDRIAGQIKTCNSENIKSVVDQVAKEGQTFCPATFRSHAEDFEKIKKRKENFEQMQLLALDFDKGISFDEVKSRAEHYDLPMLFAYDTFTSRDHDKFRVVFLNDFPVTNIKSAELMLKSLVTIFPEADPSSKSPVQMYYGSNKGPLYFDESLPTIDAESLIRNTTNYLEDKYGINHYKQHIEKLAKDTGVALNDKKLLDVSVVNNSAETTGASFDGNFLPNSTKILIPFGRFFPKSNSNYLEVNFGENSTNSLSENKKSNNHHSFRSSDLKTISSSCSLFQEFISGNRQLGHMELFGLATNLVNVETGAAFFNDNLRKHSYYEDRPQKYQKWLQDLRNIRGYKPYTCDCFCPHSDECAHGTNILSTARPKYHQIERLPNYVEHYVSIEEAAEDFKRQLQYAINAGPKKWYVIKAQTAVGKTETYLRLTKELALRVLIAVPTNKLKQEILKRANDIGIRIIESPSLHEIKDDLPPEVWSKIEHLNNSGRSSTLYLRKLEKENDPEYSELIKQHLKKSDDFKNHSGCAVTTHKMLPFVNTKKYDLVIVDEDIIFSSGIQNKTDIAIHDLEKLKEKVAPGSAILKKIKRAIKLSEKEKNFFTLPEIEYDKKNEGKPTGVDIPSFCNAKHFCLRKASDKENNIQEDCVTFLNPIHFKRDTKYIMLSATADETVCEYYFGRNNVEFYECSRAKNVGSLNQYYDKSMSRSYMRKDPSIIEKIKKRWGFGHTITFLECEKFVKSSNCMHYGNTAGRDEWKGENIDVIGTPHLPGWIYKLFAYAIGVEFDLDAVINPSAVVERNGYKFRFAAYEEKVLQNIQFYLIESEMEQAVGRARLLRCDCTVNLYSNYPLRQASLNGEDFTLWA